MKRIACMMLFMLLMLFVTALCEQPVPCYWQLRAVEVETSASDALEASALTDAVPLSGLDAEGMFRALPSSLAMSLSAGRPLNVYVPCEWVVWPGRARPASGCCSPPPCPSASRPAPGWR